VERQPHLMRSNRCSGVTHGWRAGLPVGMGCHQSRPPKHSAGNFGEAVQGFPLAGRGLLGHHGRLGFLVNPQGKDVWSRIMPRDVEIELCSN
jgi:hypothetical protein